MVVSTDTVGVRPSIRSRDAGHPLSLEQELEPFGTWVGDPLWVPPKDATKDLAKSMIRECGYFASHEKKWSAVLKHHREQFTQVREIDLAKASIRLPKGKLFVSVTERKDFHTITDSIPDCVQTRLDEFLAGPGKRSGVKVYYLKPLCVEVDDELIFTSREDLMRARNKIQEEVETEYRKMYLMHRPRHVLMGLANASLAFPRLVVNAAVQRRQRAIDRYQAKLEFERRKTALDAAKTHGEFRTDGCTFDEMLALTNPLQRTDVIEQFGEEQNLSRAKRDHLIRMAAGHIPWFIGLSLGVGYLASLAMTVTPPVLVADPAFVAEMPGARGVVLKIGHFDEIAGVKHVEI